MQALLRFQRNVKYLIDHRFEGPQDFALQTGIPEDILDQWSAGKASPLLSHMLTISAHCNLSVEELLETELSNSNAGFNQSKIRMLIMDVDGVMTDGGMYYSEKGDELKKFNTKDGMAVKQLVAKGMLTGIISSGFNRNLIQNRARLLGVHYVYAGDARKVDILEQWMKELPIEAKEIAMIGDDVNDLPVMERVGLSACPSDAIQSVKVSADVILEKKGGAGCIREFADKHLLNPGKH